MQDVDIATVKKKSLSGIIALTTRTLFLQIIAFGATFLLTIFLSPPIFGVFYVVSALISFLSYFSDIGLAAALIQKKEDISEDDLTTTFTLQQILVGILVIFSLVFSSAMARFYGLDTSGLWLLRALVVAFFLSSLKTIPSVLLERQLDFQKLVIPQILETVSFYGIAVVLAWRGWGIVSFTWAVLLRAIVGVVALYLLSPWRPRVGISKLAAVRLLRFGVPFQLNSFLALVKDDLLTVALGKILPFAQVGYIGWAKKWAEVPLRLIMDNVIRVTFPAFARLQHEQKVLGSAIEKTLFGLALAIFPITTGLVFFIQPLVGLIPRYSKWEPALTSFYLFALVSAIASLSTPLTNALNAVGKIKTTLGLMVLWATSTWVLTLLLVTLMGFNGVAVAFLLVATTIGLVVRLAQRIAAFSFWLSIRGPLLGSLVQAVWYAFWLSWVPTSWVWLILAAGSGGILYLCIMWFLERQRTGEVVAQFKPFFLWKQ